MEDYDLDYELWLDWIELNPGLLDDMEIFDKDYVGKGDGNDDSWGEN